MFRKFSAVSWLQGYHSNTEQTGFTTKHRKAAILDYILINTLQLKQIKYKVNKIFEETLELLHSVPRIHDTQWDRNGQITSKNNKIINISFNIPKIALTNKIKFSFKIFQQKLKITCFENKVCLLHIIMIILQL